MKYFWLIITLLFQRSVKTYQSFTGYQRCTKIPTNTVLLLVLETVQLNLSKLLTKCLQEIKRIQECYCAAIYNNTGINRMWILKNSATLLRKLEEEGISTASHISTWDFSTLYTTIPQKDLKERFVGWLSLLSTDVAIITSIKCHWTLCLLFSSRKRKGKCNLMDSFRSV